MPDDHRPDRPHLVPDPARLGDVAWTELVERGPVLLVPLGSCEQHGPHLPLRTDTIIASTLADRAVLTLCERAVDALAAPAIEVTASGEHQGFPGTLSIGTEAMTTLLVELVRSADWAGGVVFVNGHGGNHEAVTAATTVSRADGRRALAWWPPAVADLTADLHADLHAGHVETSILMALDPALVRSDPVGVEPTILDDDGLRRLRAEGVAPLSPSGVLGDPRAASAAAGSALLAAWVDDLVGSVTRWLGTPP